MYGEVTQQTLEKAMDLIAKIQNDPKMKKAIDTSVGLIGVNLEQPAKQLVPLLSPFRQTIPRVVRTGSDSVKYKQITALSLPKMSVAESAAAALFTTTLNEVTSTYRVHGLRGQVTREAQAASLGFDAALAKETSNTLWNSMRMEDAYFLGGNRTVLATPGAPTAAEADGKGSIGTTAQFVSIAAMTLPAMQRVTVNRPVDYDATDAFLAGTAVAAVDPASDGVTVGSSEGTTGAMTGTDNGIKITWAPVPGAAGYAVFVGGTGATTCEAIVTQTSITLTSLATGGVAESTLAGTSADTLTYDGLIPQIVANGAYVKNLAGVMAASADGEITAIQDMFANIYDTAKVGNFRLIVGGQETRLVTKKTIQAGGGPTIFVDPQGGARESLRQGYSVGSIINATTGEVVPIETHPWMPGGMIMCLPQSVPYNDANISAPVDWYGNYDWERWDYASTTSTGPIWPFETRCNGVLRLLFPGGAGLIYNIWKG